MSYLFSWMFIIMGIISIFMHSEILVTAVLFGVAALFRISWFIEDLGRKMKK